MLDGMPPDQQAHTMDLLLNLTPEQRDILLGPAPNAAAVAGFDKVVRDLNRLAEEERARLAK